MMLVSFYFSLSVVGSNPIWITRTTQASSVGQAAPRTVVYHGLAAENLKGYGQCLFK